MNTTPQKKYRIQNHIILTAKQERISNGSDQNVNVARKNPRMCRNADFFNHNVFILPSFSGLFF